MTYWYTTANTTVEREPLPFFLDSEQVADLTHGIDWSRRVGDRVRTFEQWGRKYLK